MTDIQLDQELEGIVAKQRLWKIHEALATTNVIMREKKSPVKDFFLLGSQAMEEEFKMTLEQIDIQFKDKQFWIPKPFREDEDVLLSTIYKGAFIFYAMKEEEATDRSEIAINSGRKAAASVIYETILIIEEEAKCTSV